MHSCEDVCVCAVCLRGGEGCEVNEEKRAERKGTRTWRIARDNESHWLYRKYCSTEKLERGGSVLLLLVVVEKGEQSDVRNQDQEGVIITDNDDNNDNSDIDGNDEKNDDYQMIMMKLMIIVHTN